MSLMEKMIYKGLFLSSIYGRDGHLGHVTRTTFLSAIQVGSTLNMGLVDPVVLEKKSRKENPQKLNQLSSRSHPTPRGKKDSTKRHHHRHHKRQPGEQQFPIQVDSGWSNI